MQYYIHPSGIEGEAAGVKGANINWATRKFVEKLEKRVKIFITICLLPVIVI